MTSRNKLIKALRKRRNHLLQRIERSETLESKTFDIVEFHALVWAIEELVRLYPEWKDETDRKLSVIERRL